MSAVAATPAGGEIAQAPLEGVTLVESSAGTGKTFTIATLYLRLLLERGFTVQQILVVTFTNAAVAELKERIRARILEQLSQQRSRARAAAAIASRSTPQTAVARLELALSSFDEASIFTIHGFCQRALAEHPFAAALPIHTELAASDRTLARQVVADFWREHVAHESITPEFARYLIDKRDSCERYVRLVQRQLAKPLARVIWPAAQGTEGDPLPVIRPLYEQTRIAWLGEKSSILELLDAAMAAGHINRSRSSAEALRDAAQDWDAICRGDDHLERLGNKCFLLSASRLERNTNQRGRVPAHPFFDLAEDYLSARKRLETRVAFDRSRLLERLLRETPPRLRMLKRSRQVMVFSDLLADLHERLKHNDHRWLTESLRARFPAALIDEFQDTDPLQLDIFRTIYQGSACPMFLVGDPKQSIYSFRHADLYSYLRAARWADRRWSLTQNQRSSELLLRGMNALFGANARAFALPDVLYRAVELGAKPRAVFKDSSAPRAPLQVWRLPDDAGLGLAKANARQAAVEACAVEIARLLQDALDGQITLDGRALHPRDIAVLVRSRALGSEVKRALGVLKVGAVELSNDSIFDSAEAKDWQAVLEAIAAPGNDTLLHAALATELIGCDASEIERIKGDDQASAKWVIELTHYRDTWASRGFGIMYRLLMAERSVARRLLARYDGERRLTNCLHVGEELMKGAELHSSPEELLRHLSSLRQAEDSNEAMQLRLESDQNLVQIVTIHSCKGLEYPIVFCPFICDGGSGLRGARLEGREYHDDDFNPVVDFTDYDPDGQEAKAIKRRIKLEQAAETVRLLYVALTRAVHRCYFAIGPYCIGNSPTESARSVLNWLAAGDGQPLEAWLDSKPPLLELDAAWARIAVSSGGALKIEPLPRTPGQPLRASVVDAATLTARSPAKQVAPGWRLGSYSGLSHGTRSEAAVGDRDRLMVDARSALGPLPATVDEINILRFPRGTEAGDCIHAMFERIDFTDSSGWPGVVYEALTKHPPRNGRKDDAPPDGVLAAMLLKLAADVTGATLLPDLKLNSISMQRRLTELEFNLPVPHLSSAAMNQVLDRLGYSVPLLGFGSLEGYLRGFIDLVFEHRGRYFILDWKSNHLGHTAADYARAPLENAMAEHGYHLQYLLYSVALDRYLARRISDYSYEKHIGGVLYLFVRGIQPGWTSENQPPSTVIADAAPPGVFFHRPAEATIRTVARLWEPGHD